MYTQLHQSIFIKIRLDIVYILYIRIILYTECKFTIMKKRNLPIGGGNRKRWIDRLSDEHFNSLNQKDRDNLLRFQKLSSEKEGMLITIIKLKEKIKKLKEDVKNLDEREESNYIKVQFLHNVFGCRIDVIRQQRKSSSLKLTTTGNTNKTFVRKTYKGEKLTPHYVYHGKIVSKSLEKSKNVYFKEEKKLIQIIHELTDKEPKKIDKNEIKKFLQSHFKEYIIHLMRKMGSDKFSNYKVSFDEFVKWFNKMKR